MGAHINSYSDADPEKLGRNHKTHRERKNNLTQVTEETLNKYDKESSTVQSQKGHPQTQK